MSHQTEQASAHKHDDETVLPVHYQHQEEFAAEPPTVGERMPLFSLRWAYREYIAEFWGTFMLVFFGDSAVATATLNISNAASGWLIISFGFGIGLALGVYFSASISGGHLNPAITLANALFGKISWRKVPGYMFSQLLGAFVAAATLYGIFKSQFDMFDGGNRQLQGPTGTGGIFATYAQPGNGKFFSAFSEMVNTGLLIAGIYAVCDERGTPAKGFVPMAVGGVIFAISCCSGWVTGFALNPARDFGPRIFSTILYGKAPFTAGGHYFWVPLFMPFVGAVCGLALYEFFILNEPVKKKQN
ncbi:aquaporin-like protein [Linderina pennispora]|nr:aquaporin-like protein [Linderina pennispora]